MTNTNLTDTAAYLLTITTACETDGWARLATVRMESGLTHEAADTALTELHRAGHIRLEPNPNRQHLTAADHTAAIVIGGEPRHLATTTEL